MKAISIKIHNFRSILDAEFHTSSYGLLIGANNAGKSNVIDAIRAFYEKDYKYNHDKDFPKNKETTDEESWVEIEFKPSEHEIETLKEEYRSKDETFRVRKYFRSKEKGTDGKLKSGIYAYVGGVLSDSRFYGQQNVQKGKFGEIIYIPAVSKIDEYTKLTGPSTLRDLVNNVLKKIMESSAAYIELKDSFERFEGLIKTEETEEGHSLDLIEKAITDEIEDWGTSFQLYVNPIGPSDMVKNLVGHRIHDHNLDHTQHPSAYGQGFQRNLIFTLIKVAAKFSADSTSKAKKKDFTPDMTWILFEEPEAFLHPSQIDIINRSLKELSHRDDTQITITTHNPQFVSKNIADIGSIARLYRDDTKSIVSQITADTITHTLQLNQDDMKAWEDAGIPIHDDDFSIDMESIKYALWIDSRRAESFFANKVLLVEGPTETALFNYMIDNGLIPSPQEGIYVIDTIGKFNTHRFMNLFGSLGIPHYILIDGDKGKYEVVDETIRNSSNPSTMAIDTFEDDLEEFLGIPKAGRANRKPQHVLYHIQNGTVKEEKLKELADKIINLMGL